MNAINDIQPVRIVVMGAGAVGCFFGGMLARAGHAVTLITREQHVEALRTKGLLMDTQTFSESVPIDASTEASAVAGAQIVLFCVKSTDTVAAAEQIVRYLDPSAVVLSLQNGVDNASRLQTLLSQQVIPAVVYVATEMAGPGHVKHHGRGELVIGDGPDSAQIAAMFSAAGVPVQVSENVIGALWAKLVVNCAYNALSAIVQKPYGQLVAVDGVYRVMEDVVRECQAVARASSITIPGNSLHDVERIAQTMAGQYSSTAQDLMRGKRSEIDHLNGYIVRQGEALDIPTPVNRALHTLVKLAETK